MLDTIQKKSNAEKENIENNAKLTISNMEQKYQKQLKDVQDGHNRLYSELLGHSKELEKELKAIRIENENTKNIFVSNDDNGLFSIAHRLSVLLICTPTILSV